MTANRHTWAVSAVSFVVGAGYSAACIAPAVYFDQGGHACTAVRLGSPSGFEALLLGWVPPYSIPWSANLLLVAAFIYLWRRKYGTAARLGGVAALLGLSTWAYAAVGLIPNLLLGYDLWQATLVAFATSAAVLSRLDKRQATPDFMPEVEIIDAT